MSTRRKWVGNHLHRAVLAEPAQASATAPIPLRRHARDASIVPMMDRYPIHIRQYHLDHL